MNSLDSAGRQIVEAEAVAPLTHGGDSTALAKTGLLQLAAQGQHLSVHRTGATAEGRPSHSQQFLSAAHKPRRHQECAKQGKFAGAELHRLLPQRHLAEEQMNLQRPNGDPLLKAAVPPLEQGAAAGGQFLD